MVSDAGTVTRRAFTRALVATAAVAAVPVPARSAEAARRLKVGHTGITWGFEPSDAEQAITDVASLGFHGYETFGRVLEAWEEKGGLKRVLDASSLPLVSAYCPVMLTDPARRREEVEKLGRRARLIKACGGSVAVLGPNNVARPTYRFGDHRSHIVDVLNELGRAAADAGVVGVLHPHTDTCVENREETYAVLECVDTRYVKFGPDVGQLQKAGADPVRIVQDFLPVIEHVHLKDWDGGEHHLGYCPLGTGRVDIAGVVALLESSGNTLTMMCELDPSPTHSLAPRNAARQNKAAMAALGYTFRA